MEIISAREFRSNQGKFLKAAKAGQTVLLTSREGSFRIVPVTEHDSITDRVSDSLREVKMIQAGKIKGISLDDLLNEI